MFKIHSMKNTFLFLCFVLCLNATAQETEPQPGPIITDRPDQTESPYLITKGFFQIETGFAYSEAGNEIFQEKTTTYNSTLLRYGLLDNLELRLGFDINETEKTTNNGTAPILGSGLGPLYAGIKIGIVHEKGWLPEIGFLGGVFLPFSAAEAFKTQGTGGDFRLAFSHILSEKWSFSYNFGVAWDGETPYVSYVYSGVLGYAFTSKLSGFVELYGDLPEEAESGHLLDGGLTYLLSENIQVDLAGGTGLNTDQEFFVGVGISARFPQ